jgi:hypothetical protein
MYRPAIADSKRVFWGFVWIAFVVSAVLLWFDEHSKVAQLSNAKVASQAINISVPPAQVIIQGQAQEYKKRDSAQESAKPFTKTPQRIAHKDSRPKSSSEATKTTVAETVDEPKPMLATVRVASQRTVTSTDPNMPYALEVVMQTDQPIEPVAYAVFCSGPVGRGDAYTPTGGVYLQIKNGTINNDPSTFGFEWKSPAFTPDAPIVVRLYSKEYIKVTGFQQLRYMWP